MIEFQIRKNSPGKLLFSSRPWKIKGMIREDYLDCIAISQPWQSMGGQVILEYRYITDENKLCEALKVLPTNDYMDGVELLDVVPIGMAYEEGFREYNKIPPYREYLAFIDDRQIIYSFDENGELK